MVARRDAGILSEHLRTALPGRLRPPCTHAAGVRGDVLSLRTGKSRMDCGPFPPVNSRVRWRPALAAIALMMGGTTCCAGAAPLPHPLLNEMFQDHAVLQRDRPIPVWGDARAGEQVAVSINATTVRARADADGHWRSALPAMPAG